MRPDNGRHAIANRCDRCGKDGGATIGSMFNTEQIGFDCGCEAAERAHPRYAEAVAAEAAAVKGGNYNYTGIGLPPELRRKQ